MEQKEIFAAMRDPWRRKTAAQIEGKPKNKKGKIENHIEYQIRKTNAKKWKICKPQLTLKPQNRKTDLKDFPKPQN